MLALSLRTQIVVGIAVAVLMGATRGFHFAALEHLPGASWAVFFLAGVYLSTAWIFPALLAEAAFLDYAAVTWGGIDSFCISPAYVFLVPAYGLLWFSGRWYARRHRDSIATLLPLAVSVLVATAACELVSSGSFYFLSGRFQQTSMTEFAHNYVGYFPRSLSSMLLYVGIAAGIHPVVSAVKMYPALSRFRISG